MSANIIEEVKILIIIQFGFLNFPKRIACCAQK
jgi:hypothetical protein